MKTELFFLGRRINIASRSHRRWLVVGIYAGFVILVVSWFVFYGRSTAGWLIFLAFVLLCRFLGGRSYRGGLIPAFDGGDERELIRRYRAHYVTYEYLDLAFLPALTAAIFKANPHNMPTNPALHILFDQLPYGLLVAACILYYTLPQAILLWTEPDMEQAN
jgi:hypothetical protein